MDEAHQRDTWVYESIIGALPGIRISPWIALAVQFVGFELAVLILSWYYDLWAGALVGTVAVTVATVGSLVMVRIGRRTSAEGVPEGYRRLLFGSNIEVVLSLLAFVALVTYLFVWEPQRATTTLLDSLVGPEPPALVVFLALLLMWDVCYRIGAGWWASVVGLWRSLHYGLDGQTRRLLRGVDVETVGYALVQLLFVPFVYDRPVLLAAVLGHVLAVSAVTGLSLVVLETSRITPESL